MESRTPNQAKAILIVLVIFVFGFAAGALSMNLYLRSGDAPRAHERNGKPPQEHFLGKMTDRLHLLPEQQNQIRAILDDTFGQYDAIRKDIDPRIDEVRQKGRDRIRAVLSSEQLPEFEKMVSEWDSRREKMKK